MAFHQWAPIDGVQEVAKPHSALETDITNATKGTTHPKVALEDSRGTQAESEERPGRSKKGKGASRENPLAVVLYCIVLYCIVAKSSPAIGSKMAPSWPS